MCSTVGVIHKNSLLLNQHNGDVALQDHNSVYRNKTTYCNNSTKQVTPNAHKASHTKRTQSQSHQTHTKPVAPNAHKASHTKRTQSQSHQTHTKPVIPNAHKASHTKHTQSQSHQTHTKPVTPNTHHYLPQFTLMLIPPSLQNTRPMW